MICSSAPRCPTGYSCDWRLPKRRSALRGGLRRGQALPGGGRAARRHRSSPSVRRRAGELRLYFRTKRWPDVLAQFPEATQWRHPELKAVGWPPRRRRRSGCSKRLGALRKQSKVTGCRARLTSPCTPACACGTSAEGGSRRTLRRVGSRRREAHPGPRGADNPNFRLILTDPKRLRRAQIRGIRQCANPRSDRGRPPYAEMAE